MTDNYHLHKPDIELNGYDFVCFTDNPNFKSDIWDIRLVDAIYDDGARNAKRYKLMPHRFLSEYDVSIWIDIEVKITKDIDNLVFIDNAPSPVYFDIKRNKLTSGANLNEKYQRDSKNLKNKKDATKYLNKHNCAIVDALAFKPGADKIY